jgi:hypothetical protein
VISMTAYRYKYFWQSGTFWRLAELEQNREQSSSLTLNGELVLVAMLAAFRERGWSSAATACNSDCKAL